MFSLTGLSALGLEDDIIDRLHPSQICSEVPMGFSSPAVYFDGLLKCVYGLNSENSTVRTLQKELGKYLWLSVSERALSAEVESKEVDESRMRRRTGDFSAESTSVMQSKLDPEFSSWDPPAGIPNSLEDKTVTSLQGSSLFESDEEIFQEIPIAYTSNTLYGSTKLGTTSLKNLKLISPSAASNDEAPETSKHQEKWFQSAFPSERKSLMSVRIPENDTTEILTLLDELNALDVAYAGLLQLENSILTNPASTKEDLDNIHDRWAHLIVKAREALESAIKELDDVASPSSFLNAGLSAAGPSDDRIEVIRPHRLRRNSHRTLVFHTNPKEIWLEILRKGGAQGDVHHLGVTPSNLRDYRISSRSMQFTLKTVSGGTRTIEYFFKDTNDHKKFKAFMKNHLLPEANKTKRLRKEDFHPKTPT